MVFLCHLLLGLLPASLASGRALLVEVLPAQALAAVRPRDSGTVSAVPPPDFPAAGMPGWPSRSLQAPTLFPQTLPRAAHRASRWALQVSASDAAYSAQVEGVGMRRFVFCLVIFICDPL